MSQSIIFVGKDAEDVIKSGLVHSGKVLFTAADDVQIGIYRGSRGITGLRITIKKKDDAKISS